YSLILFFLSLYLDFLFLHSFPTRRSSDLIIFDENITKHTTIVRTRFPNFRDEEEYQKDIDLMIKEAEEKKTELEKTVSINEQGIDRKSTRLNSSHDQISYAVFCLKKKKKK